MSLCSIGDFDENLNVAAGDPAIQAIAVREEWIRELDRRDADPDYFLSHTRSYGAYYSSQQLKEQAGAYERELDEYMVVYQLRRS